MSKLQIGACIYCGQTRQIETDGRKTEQDLDNMATMLCCCEEAKAAQDVEQMQTTAEANVEKLFREENPDMASLLMQMGIVTHQERNCPKMAKMVLKHSMYVSKLI